MHGRGKDGCQLLLQVLKLDVFLGSLRVAIKSQLALKLAITVPSEDLDAAWHGPVRWWLYAACFTWQEGVMR